MVHKGGMIPPLLGYSAASTEGAASISSIMFELTYHSSPVLA